MRESYDLSFAPPAPVVPLTVRRPPEGPAVALRALLDSGADVTVLPAGVPEQLGLPVTGSVAVSTSDGPPVTHTVYAALLQVGRRRFHLEVVGMGAEALAGRDLLAHFVVTLDGPAATLRLR